MGKIDVRIIVILVLIGYILFLKQCGGNTVVDVVESVKVDTIVLNDTIIEVVVEENPILIREEHISWDTLYTPVDTNGILSDYFMKRTYGDTITGDGYSIFVQEVVHKNVLDSRIVVVSVIKADTNFTITIPPIKRNKLYMGMSVGGNLNTFNVSGELLLKNKRENIYGVGYDPFNKVGYLRGYHKLSFRRKKKGNR